MMRPLFALLLVASPALATHETFGPLAPNLASGRDGVWRFEFTATGWLASNQHQQRCQKSLRIFGVSGRLISTFERPFTYSFKVKVMPKRWLDPEVGSGAGVIMRMDTRIDRWWVAALNHETRIQIADFEHVAGSNDSGRMHTQATLNQPATADSETTFKIVEHAQKTEVFVNGEPIITFDDKPRGTVGIIMYGCGDFLFRDFTLLDRHGKVMTAPQQQRPNVRR